MAGLPSEKKIQLDIHIMLLTGVSLKASCFSLNESFIQANVPPYVVQDYLCVDNGGGSKFTRTYYVLF